MFRVHVVWNFHFVTVKESCSLNENGRYRELTAMGASTSLSILETIYIFSYGLPHGLAHGLALWPQKSCIIRPSDSSDLHKAIISSHFGVSFFFTLGNDYGLFAINTKSVSFHTFIHVRVQ